MQLADQQQIEAELQQEYERFVAFGKLLDRTTRKYLVQYLQNQLQPDRHAVPNIEDQYFLYFKKAIDDIFAIRDLLDLCRKNPKINKQLVLDTLYWLRKTYDKVGREHPYEDEANRLENWQITPLHLFYSRWSILLNYLGHIYEEHEIDLRFYQHHFKHLTSSGQFNDLEEDEQKRLRLLNDDLLAQWDAKVQAKILAYQLIKLQEEQENYIALLSAKVAEYQELQNLIAPFSDYLGWDLSRALWQDTSFDILKNYQALLEDEESLQELADLLGSLREAELELEEETLDKTIIRQEWKIDEHSPAEINGVHESDDLGRLLSSEASLLTSAETEDLFLKKLVDKSLLTFRYQDRQLQKSEDHEMEVYQRIHQKEKGPFIICVDTSESMTGRPEQIAKVLSLAILKMAMREKRKAYLINFSIGIKTLDLYDIANSLDEIAAFLSMSFHGGTDISLPLYEAIRQLKSQAYQDADVLVVSDFIMYRVNEDVLKDVRHYQQNQGTQFHSLVLGKEANAAILDYFDTNWQYDPQQKGVMRQLVDHLAKEIY